MTTTTTATELLVMNDDLSKMSEELQALQRQRAIVIKSRNMQANRLQAIVAGTIGYSSSMGEKERTAKFKEATDLIKQIANDQAPSNPMCAIVKTTLIGIDAFETQKKALEKEMIARAKKLPAAAWVEHKDQRGFGLLFLAIVIGETGDMRKYSNPAKVWRRMGCAPWAFAPEGEEEKILMGATWRSGREGKLPKEEWEKFGYSPRRRSIAYLIGEGILKQNVVFKKGAEAVEGEAKEAEWMGPYRKRYEEARVVYAARHPDYTKKRCQLHGMLCATKLLLKELWAEWNGRPKNMTGWN